MDSVRFLSSKRCKLWLILSKLKPILHLYLFTRLLKVLPLFWVCFFSASLQAQTDSVYIDSILIEGNKKTRDCIILRELRFKQGDKVAVKDLDLYLEEGEQFIRNTSLFNQVAISFKSWEASTGRVKILIEVDEAWYLYPFPVFELADRNFNVWWVEQNRSLARTNYGMEFAHLNFTGQKDKLKINLKAGYTNKYSIKYSLPFVNRAQTLGVFTDFSFSRKRELNYVTVGNKQEFYNDENRFVHQRFKAELGSTYRPGLSVEHKASLVYQQIRIADTIAQVLNPNFLLNGRTLQRFASLFYTFTFDYRDVRPYPMSGNYFVFSFHKDGLGIYKDRNSMEVTARYDQYVSFSDKLSTSLSVKGKLSLIRNRQPYNDNRALGFGQDFLRGYEYYIVDGLDMMYLKANFRYRLWKQNFNFGNWVFIPQFRRMPFKLYLSVNNNIGYANDPFNSENNFLNNRLLWGGGVGFDFIFYFDKVLRVEYSVNHLLEKGLFLHVNLNI